MKKLQMPTEWWEEHTSDDLIYRVLLAVRPPGSLGWVWQKLAQQLRASGRVLVLGGAALERVDHGVRITSGGQDALDSLESALDLVVETVQGEAGGGRRVHVDAVVWERATSFGTDDEHNPPVGVN